MTTNVQPAHSLGWHDNQDYMVQPATAQIGDEECANACAMVKKLDILRITKNAKHVIYYRTYDEEEKETDMAKDSF